ncbi:cytokinin-o-glucosyltransferase 2 [Hordeum vulgare]|nr:cytokinin-o-glucosyltransferase 2 [Hordeum vulgare]
MDGINEFAWNDHFLAAGLNEVKKYQNKRNEVKTGFWIGGCLPMFVIIYMDFVEVPHLLASEHRIDYSLPRSFFVCNDDFKLIEEIDRNKLSIDKIDFGRRNIPSHMIPINDKHKKLRATEVKMVLKSFGQVLEGMFSKHLASIVVETNATATSTNDHMPKDVTFDAPDGNAADVDHTRAPILTSPEAHKSHATQEVDVDTEVAGCTNTGQNEAHRDIRLEKMQSCGFQGMEDVQ